MIGRHDSILLPDPACVVLPADTFGLLPRDDPEGARRDGVGAAFGFACGVLMDVNSAHIAGFNALLLMVIGCAAGLLVYRKLTKDKPPEVSDVTKE